MRDLSSGVETRVVSNPDFIVGFDWTPDGTALVYDVGGEIRRIDREGLSSQLVLNARGYDDAPAVRPTDGRLAFHNASREGGGVFTAAATGAGRARVPNTQPGDYWPTWSADGQWLAFLRTDGAATGYYKVKPDGTGLTRLSPDGFVAPDSPAGWTPDGAAVLAAGTLNGVAGLYALAADGGGATAVAATGAALTFAGNVKSTLVLPAAGTNTWVNAGGGSWSVAANWSLGRVPVAGDDVVIPDLGAAGASLTVTFDGPAATVRSLTSAENLTLTGGTLTVTGTLASSAAVTLAGGTLAQATVRAGTALGTSAAGSNFGGRLVAVTIEGTLAAGGRIDIAGGLTVNGTATVSGGGSLRFDATQTLGGSGTVALDNGSLTSNGGSAVTMTLGQTLTVRGAGSVGAANVAVVNRGTIRSDGGKQTLTVLGGALFNAGRLEVIDGTLTVAPARWDGSGFIAVTGGTLNLGGSFTPAAVSHVTNAGGTVSLQGTLANAGRTLTLDAATGSWSLDGGSIAGGAVRAVGGSRLVGTNSGGALSGVTLRGDPAAARPVVLDVAGYGPVVTVVGDLTLDNAAVRLAGGERLEYPGAGGALAGSGAVLLGDAATYSIVRPTASGGRLTIAAGVTVSGAAGTLGYSRDFWGGPADVAVVNLGTVEATGGGTVTVDGGSFTNGGTLRASGGGTLVVQSAAVTNFVAGTLTGGAWEAVNATLRVILPGALTTSAAAILLDGAGARFYRDGGTTEALSELAANASAGRLTLRNGTLAVETGATFAPVGGFTQTAGATALAGGTLGAPTPPAGSDLRFDGVDDLVAVADSPSLRPASLTAEAWVNFSALPSNVGSIFGKTVGSGYLDSFAVWYQNGTLYAGVSSASALDYGGFAWNPPLNTWHHVALTFDDAANALTL